MCSSFIDHSHEMNTEGTSPTKDHLSSFRFQKRFCDIDWRRISCIDIDKVITELDFTILQENINCVTFCNVDLICGVDPLVAKLLKLAQYTIEYLLHSQDYLQSVIEDLQNKNTIAQRMQNRAEVETQQYQREIDKIKGENKKRKKMIQQQQLLIETGASSFFQCPHCEKAFMNASFLQAHIGRRHPNASTYVGDVISHAEKEQRKLTDQICILREEMNIERENFNKKWMEAMSCKKKWEEKTLNDMELWKEKEALEWQKRFDEFKRFHIAEMEQSKKREVIYEQKIEGLQKAVKVNMSNLGELVGDSRDDKDEEAAFKEKVYCLERMNDMKDDKIADLSQELVKLRCEDNGKYEAQHHQFLNEIKHLNGTFIKAMEQSRVDCEDEKPKQFKVPQNEQGCSTQYTQTNLENSNITRADRFLIPSLLHNKDNSKVDICEIPKKVKCSVCPETRLDNNSMERTTTCVSSFASNKNNRKLDIHGVPQRVEWSVCPETNFDNNSMTKATSFSSFVRNKNNMNTDILIKPGPTSLRSLYPKTVSLNNNRKSFVEQSGTDTINRNADTSGETTQEMDREMYIEDIRVRNPNQRDSLKESFRPAIFSLLNDQLEKHINNPKTRKSSLKFDKNMTPDVSKVRNKILNDLASKFSEIYGNSEESTSDKPRIKEQIVKHVAFHPSTELDSRREAATGPVNKESVSSVLSYTYENNTYENNTYENNTYENNTYENNTHENDYSEPSDASKVVDSSNFTSGWDEGTDSDSSS